LDRARRRFGADQSLWAPLDKAAFWSRCSKMRMEERKEWLGKIADNLTIIVLNCDRLPDVSDFHIYKLQGL
jgi:hypothetical protein